MPRSACVRISVVRPIGSSRAAETANQSHTTPTPDAPARFAARFQPACANAAVMISPRASGLTRRGRALALLADDGAEVLGEGAPMGRAELVEGEGEAVLDLER